MDDWRNDAKRMVAKLYCSWFEHCILWKIEI